MKIKIKIMKKVLAVCLIAMMVLLYAPIRTEAAGNKLSGAAYVKPKAIWDNIKSTAVKIHYVLTYSEQCDIALFDDTIDNYYTFSLNKAETVKLTTRAEGEYVYYTLYNEDGEEEWEERFSGNDISFSKAWKLKKGKYYLEVKCEGDGEYRFMVQTSSNGWKKIDGKKYFYENGVKQKGWKMIDRCQYYFNNQGVMQTGWKTINGKKRYFKKTGTLAREFLKIDGKWYYFNLNGWAVTGFQKINEKWYYFKKTGEMAKRFLKINGRWYFFKKTGVMATDWLKIDGKWYYFGKKGSMAIGKKIKLGSKVYKFNSTGVCTNK